MIDRLYEPVPVGDPAGDTLVARQAIVLSQVRELEAKVDAAMALSSDITSPANAAREALDRLKAQIGDLDARLTAIAQKLEPVELLHTLLTNPEIAAIVTELRKDALKAASK